MAEAPAELAQQGSRTETLEAPAASAAPAPNALAARDGLACALPCLPSPLTKEAFRAWWQQTGDCLAELCADAAAPGMVNPALVVQRLHSVDNLCCNKDLDVDLEVSRPLGLPVKHGVHQLLARDWDQIYEFIRSRVWWHDLPVCMADLDDRLVATNLPYGAFMLGFDFHIMEEGPRLIEINTNAGGLATVFSLHGNEVAKSMLRKTFVTALCQEYQLATGRPRPQRVAIVDTAVTTQGLYPEMLHFAKILQLQGIQTVVVSPEDLRLGGDSTLLHGDQPIDLVYNRLVDFRLTQPEHAHLRQAALAGRLVITPHPAAYSRIADKRNLLRLNHPLVPEARLLSDKNMDDWVRDKKNWVFKPADGAGSKGVYRGDKVSVAKLRSLEANTIAQRLCQPGVSEDGTKYDLRVFTHGTTILGLASRHFTGQVMEMNSPASGFRAALPDNVCCFPMLVKDHSVPPSSSSSCSSFQAGGEFPGC